VIVFDLETQYLASEVGGWSNIEALRVAVACTWDERNEYRTWWEAQVGDLLTVLRSEKFLVGFNVNKFDFRVLSLYGDCRGFEDKTFDILDEIRKQGKRLVNLNRLATINLGETKMVESGVDAVGMWRKGELDHLAMYCQRDVELTKRLFEFWRDNGLLFVSGADYVVFPGLNTD